MDDSPLRRGRPTAHVVFGEAMAILAGDALLTLGLSTLARHPEGERYAPVRARAVEVVAEAVGSTGMIGGQVTDLEEAGRGKALAPTLSRQEREDAVLSIHDAKTGRLIRASLAVGGLVAFASEAALEALDSFGRALGLAFQIKDDLLDVESDSSALGKSAGSDSRARKLTFPAVYGVERSHVLLEQKIAEASAAARSLPGGGGALAGLARFAGERRS
jgi:geranylgeranyl pyrophosphate synthase